MRSAARKTAALLTTLGLALITLARPAGAGEPYSTATKQPCVACHTSSTAGDLSARGAAFAAVESHRAEPAAAWTEIVATMPIDQPSSGGLATIAPLVVVAAGAAGVAIVRWRRR